MVADETSALRASCYPYLRMKLIINGEERAFEGIANVAELIDKLGIKEDRVAVELNREIVPRAQWTSSALKEGDKLEIVHFVGGGICDWLCPNHWLTITSNSNCYYSGPKKKTFFTFQSSITRA